MRWFRVSSTRRDLVERRQEMKAARASLARRGEAGARRRAGRWPRGTTSGRAAGTRCVRRTASGSSHRGSTPGRRKPASTARLAQALGQRPLAADGEDCARRLRPARRLRVLRPVGAVLRVVVVAATGLPAQPSGGHHPRLDRARLPARLAERQLRERLGHLEAHVDAHQVHQLERAPSGSRRRGGRCGRSARGWPPAPEAAAAPRPRTAGRSGSRGSRGRRWPGSRSCPSPRRWRAPRATARSPVWSARITSSSFISGGGLKKCIPTTFSGRAAAPASEVTGIDDVFVASTASSAQTSDSRGEQLALQVEALGGRLDHEVAVAPGPPARRRARAPRPRPPRSCPSRSSARARGGPARPRPRAPRAADRGAPLACPPRSRAGRCRRPSCRRRPRRACSAAPCSPAAELRLALLEERPACPRRRSSVAMASSNRRRSCASPAPRVVSSAASTACLASRAAIGGRRATTAASSSASVSHSFDFETLFTRPIS